MQSCAIKLQKYQVICERLAPAVPESVHKDLVVLDGNGADGRPQVKGAPLEHHTVLIVDAGAFWKDQQWGGVWRRYMSLHPFPNKLPVFHLHACACKAGLQCHAIEQRRSNSSRVGKLLLVSQLQTCMQG